MAIHVHGGRGFRMARERGHEQNVLAVAELGAAVDQES
jgi:hypothetical protein